MVADYSWFLRRAPRKQIPAAASAAIPQAINGYCRSLGKGAALDDLRLVFPAFVHQAFGGVSVVAVPLHFEPDDIGAHIRWRACISPAVLVLRVEKALHIVTAHADDAIVDRGCGLLDAVLLSAHIGGKSLIDELLQRLRLLLFRDGAYDGFTHDIAAAVDHIGGGIGKDVGGKLSRLTI